MHSIKAEQLAAAAAGSEVDQAAQGNAGSVAINSMAGLGSSSSRSRKAGTVGSTSEGAPGSKAGAACPGQCRATWAGQGKSPRKPSKGRGSSARVKPSARLKPTGRTSGPGSASHAQNVTGHMGVRVRAGRYEAFIATPPFRYLYVGQFRTITEAVAARDTALLAIYGEEAAEGLGNGWLSPAAQRRGVTASAVAAMAVKLSGKEGILQEMQKRGTDKLLPQRQQQQQVEGEGQQGDEDSEPDEEDFLVARQQVDDTAGPDGAGDVDEIVE
eukprot:gene12358-12492_t